MKTKENQEKKLELKDCLAIKNGLGNVFMDLLSRGLFAIWPAAMLMVFLISFQNLIGSVPLNNETKMGIVIFGFGAWLISFLLIAMILREPLVEYWRRNVVGYTLHLFYGEDGETVETFIHYGRTDKLGEGGTQRDIYFYVPLGGWLRQPFIKRINNDYRGDNTKGYWHLKMAAPYYHVGEKDCYFLYLCDNHGGRFRSSIEEILWVITQYPQGSIAHVIYMRMRRRKFEVRADDMANRFDQVVYAATRATAAIAETSRFGHSQEGEGIRRKLTKAIIKALPHGDSRIEPLQASLETKVGRRPKVAARA